VEPCRCERARPVGDADDCLIERLRAIASILDPVPAAVQENARRLFEINPIISNSTEPARLNPK
jgi:hypothetical protein